MKRIAILLICWGVCSCAGDAGFQAGIARKVITPQSPIWMSGFHRNHVSEGVAQDLNAKALALDDGRGGRLVIVTLDVLGLPPEVSEAVAAKVLQKHDLQRSQLVLCPSHTHSGPLVWPNTAVMFEGTEEERRVCEQYARTLVDDLAGVIDEAFANLAPAEISSGHGTCDFAVNRRMFTPTGVKFGENPDGPVDHDVPVIRIAGPDGALRAILFGYACHNVVMGGSNYMIHGDYAGCAQAELEKDLPGVTAMFMILCAGDQDPPAPRYTFDIAAERGRTLAGVVQKVLRNESELRPVSAPIRTAYETIQLDFAPHERATFEKDLQQEHPVLRRRAEWMVQAYDAGRPIRHIDYPVQVVRWGRNLTLVALGGEVVVDYALRLKREFPQENLIVAGYANEVKCYIPSVRILREGGYEAERNMGNYGMPGPLAESVEEKIITTCRSLLNQTK